jgi:hypothetical protein
MKITDLTAENVNFIVDNLWNRGRQELEVFGTSIEEYRKRCMEMVGEPFTGTFLDDDGNACAFLFLRPILDYRQWNTTFAATEEGFNKIWFPMSKFLRQFSDVIVLDNNVEIQLLSAHSNGKAHEWFSFLGFRKVSVEGKITKYIKKKG